MRQPLGPRPGPEWWTPECDDAWAEINAMIENAVVLSVPDYAGALDDTNPFRLYPDACKYGVGAGFFQLSKGDKDKLANTHYNILGLAPNATQADITRALAQAKRRTRQSGATLQAVTETGRVLGERSLRSSYDEQLGVLRRLGRLDLVPLGLFSKSLSKQQLACKT